MKQYFGHLQLIRENWYLRGLGGQLWAKNLVGDGDDCLVIIMMIISDDLHVKFQGGLSLIKGGFWNVGPLPCVCHAQTNPLTGPLKPKVASKNPWMGDYIQKKDLDKGFILAYVATIFIEGNID